MTDWPREPQHPQEPTPLQVAHALLDPFNWMRLGLATNVWMMQKLLGGFTRR